MLLKELVILSEGAVTRASDRKREEVARFSKETTDFSATYDKLTPAKKKRVDDAISGATKVGKVIGCTPMVALTHFMSTSTGYSKADKWRYEGTAGDGSASNPRQPKTDAEVMKQTGISKQELDAMENLDYRDELIALKAKLKAK